MNRTVGKWLKVSMAGVLFCLGGSLFLNSYGDNPVSYSLKPGTPFGNSGIGFSAMFPSEFSSVRKENQHSVIKGVPVSTTSYMTNGPNSSCGIALSDYQKTPNLKSLALEGAQHGFITSINGTIDNQAENKKYGYRVLTTYFHFPASASVTGYGHVDHMVIGMRLYQTMCIGASDSLIRSPQYQKFFQSVRLGQQKAK